MKYNNESASKVILETLKAYFSLARDRSLEDH